MAINNTNRNTGRINIKRGLSTSNYVMAYFNYLVYALVIIILLANYAYLLKPKYDDITANQLKYISEQEKISSLNMEVNRLDAIKKSYDNVNKDEIDKINAILPDSTLNDHLLTDVSHLVAANGLILNSISISMDQGPDTGSFFGEVTGDGSGPTKIGKLRIDLEISGADYISLKKMITAIERNLRLMDITRLEFSPKGKSIILSLMAYYKN